MQPHPLPSTFTLLPDPLPTSRTQHNPPSTDNSSSIGNDQDVESNPSLPFYYDPESSLSNNPSFPSSSQTSSSSSSLQSDQSWTTSFQPRATRNPPRSTPGSSSNNNLLQHGKRTRSEHDYDNPFPTKQEFPPMNLSLNSGNQSNLLSSSSYLPQSTFPHSNYSSSTRESTTSTEDIFSSLPSSSSLLPNPTTSSSVNPTKQSLRHSTGSFERSPSFEDSLNYSSYFFSPPNNANVPISSSDNLWMGLPPLPPTKRSFPVTNPTAPTTTTTTTMSTKSSLDPDSANFISRPRSNTTGSVPTPTPPSPHQYLLSSLNSGQPTALTASYFSNYHPSTSPQLPLILPNTAMQLQAYHYLLQNPNIMYAPQQQQQPPNPTKSSLATTPTSSPFTLMPDDPYSQLFAGAMNSIRNNQAGNLPFDYLRSQPLPNQQPLLQDQRESQQSVGPSQRTDNNNNNNNNNNDPLSKSKSSRFMLVEQPQEIQRKSYKKENRCLLPNPLTISHRELQDHERELPAISDGTVTVKLVNADCTDLPFNKQGVLQSVEGGLTHPLNKKNRCHFSLKISETSEGQPVRLQFTVNYRTVGSSRSQSEAIYSRPFSVKSKKKKKEQALAHLHIPLTEQEDDNNNNDITTTTND